MTTSATSSTFSAVEPPVWIPAPSSLYTIRVGGRLGVTALSAFRPMVPELVGSETVLTGQLQDQSAVFGVLVHIEAFGLELLEPHQIGPPPSWVVLAAGRPDGRS